MTIHVPDVFLYLLGVIAVASIISGTVLAISNYSSAGAFAIAAACVGVLGTLAAGGSGQATAVPPAMPDEP